MALVATPVPLEVIPGRLFERSFTYLDAQQVPVNLTGRKAKLEARRYPGGDLLFTLSSELSEEKEGDIALGGAEGTIDLTMTGSATAGLSWTGNAEYDLALYTTIDDAVSLFAGPVTLGRKVTDV